MSLFAPLLTACLVASAPQSDKETELRNYLLNNYAHPEKVMARTFVADATAANIIETVDDKILAKRVLRLHHTKKGDHAGRERGAGATDYGRHPSYSSGMPGQAEEEFNDTFPYAQHVGSGSGSVDGELTPAGDDDTFHYFMIAPGMLSVSVVGDTLGDPNLTILDNTGQPVAFNDDAVGLDPRIDVFLPAGVFYLQVGGFLGDTGTYTMEVEASAFSAPALPTNELVNASLDSADGGVFRLQLDEDSRVNMAFGGALDLALEIVTASGASFFFVDDSNGLLPEYDASLPAGVYFLRITEFTGTTGAYTLQVDTTSGIPAFPCGSTVTGTVTDGVVGQAWYALDLATAQQVTATTSAASSNSITDTILFLFDAQLRFLSSNDDTNGLFSEIATPLPAGRYYVLVDGFGSASGDFDLTGVCAAASAPLVAVIGANAGELVNEGDIAVYSLTIETPLPLSIAVDTPNSTIDPVLSVLDGSGRVVVFDDDGGPGLDSFGHGRLAPGVYSIIVRDFGNNSSGEFDLTISAPLSWDAGRVPTAIGSEGDLVALFAGAFTSPPLWVLPHLTEGYLLMDPSVFILLGTQTVGADGTATFPAVPTKVPYVQALTFLNGGFPAQFSNRLPQ